MFSNKAWADQNDLDFPVLSDFWPHGAVTDAYGTFDRHLTPEGNRVVAERLLDILPRELRQDP